MIMEDIPKIYTAIAEWLACLIFVVILKKRWSKRLTVFFMACSFLILMIVQELIGIAPIYLWMVGMAFALLIMYGSIMLCCDLSAVDAGLYLAIAFIFAEFIASLEWQLYSFIATYGYDSMAVQILTLLICYGGCFAFMFRLESGRLTEYLDLKINKKEFYSAMMISVGAFLISNISYIEINTPLSGRMSMEIFIIRTLVDLAGVVMLVSHQDRLREFQMLQEMKSINTLLHHQYEQYKTSRESIELINRKYHDLKHQINIIRMESDVNKREEYLRQMEQGVEDYAASHQTGNTTLDTILTGKQLYCQQHQIQLNVVADGQRLDFMDVMDLCSIFGNAIDNAIESVERLTDKEKRLIQLAVYAQNSFLMIRLENYYETPLQKNGESYETTKKDREFHGFGIKSIRYTAEKYGGSVHIKTEDNWFSLRVLLPLPDELESSD